MMMMMLMMQMVEVAADKKILPKHVIFQEAFPAFLDASMGQRR